MTARPARVYCAPPSVLRVPPDAPELRAFNEWLDTWRGIGDVVAGMAREEYDLELRRYNGRGWRAVFFPEGFEHSLTSHERWLGAESVGLCATRCQRRAGQARAR